MDICYKSCRFPEYKILDILQKKKKKSLDNGCKFFIRNMDSFFLTRLTEKE